MDQVKIGKFISNERKAKGYTQKQLSELLGYLKCPHCKTRTWCKKVMTKECGSNHIDMVWQQQVAFQNMNLSV